MCPAPFPCSFFHRVPGIRDCEAPASVVNSHLEDVCTFPDRSKLIEQEITPSQVKLGWLIVDWDVATFPY